MKERFKISTLEIAGFVSVLAALRLPFGKEMRSEAEWSPTVIAPDNIQFHSSFCINEKDLQLMSTLIKRGDEHAKAIRGLQVYAVIEAPRWMWQEIDTYRIGTDRLSSESTMHIDAKGLSNEELMDFKDHIEEGKIQKRIQMFSYQTLRRIYFQRRNHRLPVWHQFCEWIESLPFAEELITIEKDEK